MKSRERASREMKKIGTLGYNGDSDINNHNLSNSPSFQHDTGGSQLVMILRPLCLLSFQFSALYNSLVNYSRLQGEWMQLEKKVSGRRRLESSHK